MRRSAGCKSRDYDSGTWPLEIAAKGPRVGNAPSRCCWTAALKKIGPLARIGAAQTGGSMQEQLYHSMGVMHAA